MTAVQIAQAAGESTPVEVTAEPGRLDEQRLDNWSREMLAISGDSALDADLKAVATEIASDLLARMRQMYPDWVAAERDGAALSMLKPEVLSRRLYRRALNEMALWNIELATGAEAVMWQAAASAPRACETLPTLPYARLIAMIQAAPQDSRRSLVAALRTVLARWGTTRTNLPTRPSTDEMEAAYKAVARVRAGMADVGVPMSPFLAERLFSTSNKARATDRWGQCALSQWWLNSQLASNNADRGMAMTVFGYSTVFNPQDFVPQTYMKRWKAGDADGARVSYPPAARYFELEGTTTYAAETDGQGRFLYASIVARSIRVPGVLGNPPVAFETLFDAATLDFAKRRTYGAGSSRQSRATVDWKLSGAKDEGK